ncbi:MAG: hypothetical protein ACE5HQ_11335 [Gemmatimonadota bacterium]
MRDSDSAKAQGLLLDVVVEGEPARRGARVRVDQEGLQLDDRGFPLDSVFWISRRAGLLLVFAHDFTLALKGSGRMLDELARRIERRGEHGAQRRSLLQPLAGEVIVCTAGTAAVGRVDGDPVRGLYLAICTQRALHLLSRETHHVVRWPVQRVDAPSGEGQGEFAELLRLTADRTDLRLRYLFPEEIRAVARVARGTPGGQPVHDPVDLPPLEMFARGEVAPPVPPTLPEFSLSVKALSETPLRVARSVQAVAGGEATFGRAFFEEHFQELGQMALGPVIMRKSAASGTHSLLRALEVLDTDELRDDTAAAVVAAVDRSLAVYSREIDARLDRVRATPEVSGRLRISESERHEVTARTQAAVARLEPFFVELRERQEFLRERLRVLDDGPPGAGEDGVREAAERWESSLRRLDRAYAAAWNGLLEEISALWRERWIPRLVEATALPNRRIAENVQLAIMAVATVIVMALLVALLM